MASHRITTPPPSAPSSNTPDTVPRSRNTSTRSYRTGDLMRGRAAVLKDLGPIPIVPLDYFNSAVLPPLPPGIDVQKIERALQASGHILSGKWHEYQSTPNKDSANEADYYQRLCNVFNAVIAQAEEDTMTSAKVEFIQKPNSVPVSERMNTSKPDGYLLLKEKRSISTLDAESRDSWDDIAVPFEFKKFDTEKDRQDDERKLIWSLHHIMRSDPCRRSTLGVTIEGANMRLWFTCRSVTMVSEPFDFIRDTAHLVRFFCAVAFADDHELGWDPTIRRVGRHAQYEITLNSPNGPSVYVTTGILSDIGAEAMTGRGTWVFKGYLKSDPDRRQVVIKDTWRDSCRDREDTILKHIFADMVKVMGLEAAQDAKKCFLTILHVNNVMIKENQDNTLNSLRGRNPPSNCRMHEIPPEELPNSDKPRKGNTSSHPMVRQTANYQVNHRIHTRIVFQEVCETLYAVRDLRDVMQILLDVAKTLQMLHSVGWVHRDISPGNIMRIGGLVKLGDLEYAKKLKSDKTHEFRTGTHHFMACEVESQKYLLHDITRLSLQPTLQTDDSDEAPTPPFTFNPIHDLESLWWVWAWVMYFYVDEPGKAFPDEQAQAFRSLFPDYVPAARLGSLTSSLDKNVPTAFRAVMSFTEQMRRRLAATYTRMEEAALPPNYKSFVPSLTDFFIQALQLSVNSAGGIKLYVPSGCHKRKEPSREEGNLVQLEQAKQRCLAASW